MFERALFLSRVEAEAFPGHPGAVLVSITDPETPAPALGPYWRDVLRLQFYDADDDVAEAVEREGLVVCHEPDARRIVSFLERWHGEPEGPPELVAHCEAGVSRSAAVARFAAERYGLAFRWDHPWYNGRVLRLLEAVAAQESDARQRQPPSG